MTAALQTLIFILVLSIPISAGITVLCTLVIMLFYAVPMQFRTAALAVKREGERIHRLNSVAFTLFVNAILFSVLVPVVVSALYFSS